ncbi:MAG: condensation domain-containing protein, partial [Cyanobacteriota bacterium]|nr:condensation domain-containing protein [Cyanobacteriota bacterium]
EDASTPFDLGSGLLLRARLLAVSDAEHWLLITHHHIASDGWSLSVLARDLSAFYNALRHGASPRLAPLAAHYQDYAVWQRQRLSGERLKALLDYWIPQLSDLEPLALPTDHPRPATPSHQGAQMSFRIAAARLAPLEDLCRSEGATLQMGLLALVATLLHRHSRQDDLAIGIPIWGRNHPDLEALIGYFINTLAIRTRFSTDLSFRQLLGQIRASSTAAYDHQDLPFEQIVEALNLARDTSRNPLVQVMLQLVELPPVSLSALDGLEVDGLATRGHAAKLDLSFKFRRSPDQGLEATITYATDLFAPDRIERLACHLQHLLASVLQSPDAAAASLAILPDSERALITAWQHGPRIEAPQWCVHQLFEQQVQRSPDATALIFDDQQLTYRELNARSNQLAEQLIALGVGTDVIVAVCLERSLELIIAILAVLKAGGAYLPIDASWPPARIAALTQTASSFQITRAESAAALQITAGDRVSSVMFDPFRASPSDRNP